MADTVQTPVHPTQDITILFILEVGGDSQQGGYLGDVGVINILGPVDIGIPLQVAMAEGSG